MTAIATRGRLLLAGFATAAMLAAPAPAGAAAASSAPGCPAVPVAQPFAPWADTADYFLAPDGGFEQGGRGWSLRGGATTTAGNEPFKVVAPTDKRSLQLPASSSATSAPFCIGVEHRSMRFFARAQGSSSLNVDVLYTDARGAQRAQRIGTLSGAGAWAPTAVVPMVVNALAAEQGNAMTVRLRFATGAGAPWAIDDVHVDPYRVR